MKCALNMCQHVCNPVITGRRRVMLLHSDKSRSDSLLEETIPALTDREEEEGEGWEEEVN